MHVHATAFSGLFRRCRRLVCGLWLAASAAQAAPAVQWSVEVTPDGEIFPALQLAERRSTDAGNGLFAVTVSGLPAATAVRVRVDASALAAPATATALATGSPLRLRPRLDWNPAALRALGQTRTQILQVTLDIDGQRQQRPVAVRLHPLDEAAYYVRDGEARVDLSWSFAAYVDPFDPAIDTLLAEARAQTPDFDATTLAPAQRVRRQLRALWAALGKRGVRYDATDPALARGPVVWSQRVRSASQVLREGRANCIDGSVLIASVLERLGLGARIALVPRHAFVGYLAPGAPEAVYMETTLLGSADFDAALRAGAARWRKAARQLDGRHAPAYALIDVGTARAYGIIPLGAALRATESPLGSRWQAVQGKSALQ